MISTAQKFLLNRMNGIAQKVQLGTLIQTAEKNTRLFDVTDAETSTTDAGAISTTVLLTNISSAGAETRTLAAPPADGVVKMIKMTVDGGDVTVAATNIDAGTGDLTFDDVNDSIILLSLGGKWRKIGGNVTPA